MKTILATALAGLLAWPVAAREQQQCAPRDAAISSLAKKYGETRHSMGLSRAGVFEIFGNVETGTWTATITNPQGITCMIASGEMFSLTDDPLPPQGEEG